MPFAPDVICPNRFQPRVRGGPKVDWNRIVNELSDINAINFQAWVVGEFSIKKAGDYLISCTHLHNVELVTPAMRCDGGEAEAPRPPSSLFPFLAVRPVVFKSHSPDPCGAYS